MPPLSGNASHLGPTLHPGYNGHMDAKPNHFAQQKTCSKCLRLRPSTDFRYVNRQTRARHSICRDCRRLHDQERRQSARDRLLQQEIWNVRRARTSETIENLVRNVAARLGGLEAVGEVFATLIRDDTLPVSRRLAATQTLVHMAIVADQESQRERAGGGQKLILSADPEPPEIDAAVRELHRRGRLAPALQRMFVEGLLDFDHIDPPPADFD